MEENGRSSQFFTGWQRPLHSLQNNRLTLNMLNLEASKLYYAAFTKSNCHNIKFAFKLTSSWQENCLKPLWQKSLLTVYSFIVISLTPYLLKIKFLSLRNLSKVNQLPKKFDYLKHTRYVQNNSIIFYLKRQFATLYSLSVDMPFA